MYGNRGDTIQPNGYLADSNPRKEIEMRNFNDPADRKQNPQLQYQEEAKNT